MQAILDAPAPTTRDGLRDRAMLHLCFAGGLRVSELVGLRHTDVTLQPHASILVHGKGRRERSLPLWKGRGRARAWLAVRRAVHTPELFVNARGSAMTRSGFEYILAKHVEAATRVCPSLAAKHVSPHVLRHTCALTVLQATKDLRKVSLWLGHAHMQTTEMYTRADPSVKLEALEAMLAPKLRSGRFRATDELIASLTSRSVMRRAMPPASARRRASSRRAPHYVRLHIQFVVQAMGTIFPGAACVAALVDRFVQHCHIIDIDADSWRQKESENFKQPPGSKAEKRPRRES